MINIQSRNLIFLVALLTAGNSLSNVRVSDDAVRRALEEALNKPIGSSISVEDMAIITSLYVNERRITDLTGLETAIELRSLHAANNDITNLTPLVGLARITELHLPENRTKIPA